MTSRAMTSGGLGNHLPEPWINLERSNLGRPSFASPGSAVKSVSASGPGLRICLAASAGGHLAELSLLEGALEPYERFLVTVKSPHSLSVMPVTRTLFVRRIERNPANLVVNSLQAILIAVREKPSVVVTTGSGDMVPLALVAAILGTPLVFMESVARVRRPSLTGRLLAHWSQLVMIPWTTLGHAYPMAVGVAGMIQPPDAPGALIPQPKVLVLTGTGPRGFDRLLRDLDTLVNTGRFTHQLFAQIGNSSYRPTGYAYERFIPHPRLLGLIRESDIVITHDGAGSIREALAEGKTTIVVPREARRGEIGYRSEAELARHLNDLGWISMVDDVYRIPAVLARRDVFRGAGQSDGRPDARAVLRQFLSSLEAR